MNFECKYDVYQFWDGSTDQAIDKSLYTCIITSSSITKRNTEINSIVGIHRSGKTGQDVEAVEFKDTIVEYFPRGLNKIFPGLIALRINNCGLLEITRDDLKGLEDLEMLNLAKNELISLADDLLEDMSKLKVIRCDENQIRYMSSKVIKPVMNTVEIVNFSKNKKIDSFSINSYSSNYHSIPVEELMQKIDVSCDPPLLVKTSNDDFRIKFAKGFESLWLNGQLSDFTINVGAKKFLVHKNVLAISSSRFAKMFADEKMENHAKELNIEDLQEKSVEDFLRYLYTGNITEDINAEEIFSLAAKLNIPELKRLTENLIEDNIEESNALKVFCLGHAYESDKLKQASQEAALIEVKKMFPDKTISNSLMENPQALKELIETKQKLDRLVSDFKDL